MSSTPSGTATGSSCMGGHPCPSPSSSALSHQSPALLSRGPTPHSLLHSENGGPNDIVETNGAGSGPLSLPSSHLSSSAAINANNHHHQQQQHSNGGVENNDNGMSCHLSYSSRHNMISYRNPSEIAFTVNDSSLVCRSSGRETPMNTDKHLSTAGGLSSIIPPNFQIKQEAGALSPPIRSLSVHSLPGTLAPHFQTITSGGHLFSNPFVVRKQESCDGSELLVSRERIDLSRSSSLCSYSGPGTTVQQQQQQDLHVQPQYICSSVDPNRSVLSQAGTNHLLDPLRSIDNSSQLSIFTGSHHIALSPLSLTPQGPGANPHRGMISAPVIDFNSNTLSSHIVDPTGSHLATNFDPNEQQQQQQNQQHHLSIAPNFTILTSNSIPDAPNKRPNVNGNGHCSSSFNPCDLSASNLPLGLSPRSKSRRYSYPYEPVGLVKSCSKDYYISTLERTSHNSPSPHMFRHVVNSSLSAVGGGMGESMMMSSVAINGCRTLSTPLSSCGTGGGNDDTQPINLIGDSSVDQKSLLQEGGEVPLPGFSSPESAFYQYQHRMEGQRCQVCGELAAGFHHGAYVCEACKKFFMRHSLTDTKPTNVCPTGGNCVVAKGSRGKCQICRYRKCLLVGMKMKDPETQPEIDISNIPCRVCGGRSSGFHFGALTCEGCKGFFRRTEGSAGSLVCVGGQNACTITPRSRNACKSCRFRRCIAAGMSKKGSRIGRQPNAVKFHCAIEIRQLRSLRGNLGNQGDSLSAMGGGGGGAGSSSNNYTPFGLDVTHGLETGGPGSLQNRSDVESPKYSPEMLTPTYSTKRDPNPWLVDQKPPLSLLLFLPHASDAIDVTASCGSCPSDETNKRAQQYSPNYPGDHHHRTDIGGGRCDVTNEDTGVVSVSGSRSLMGTNSDNSVLNSLSHPSRMSSLDNGDQLHLEQERRSNSDDDEEEEDLCSSERLHINQQSTRIPSGSTSSLPAPNRTPDSLTAQSLLAPFGYQLDSAGSNTLGSGSSTRSDKADQTMGLEDGNSSGIHPFTLSAAIPTTTLIARLAQKLAEEDDGFHLLDDTEDVNSTNGCPPTQDDIVRFTDGMRTATEFLRLPNTYFKTRFRMTSIPPDQQNNTVHVWGHMMNHFHMHAQQIVQFAKLVPGFNQLGITARSNLVRGAMYPVVMLLLSRDYQPETDEYNYFDFTPEERTVIMHHFSTYIRFTEHLRMAGRLLHHLGLTLPELSLWCAVEILRNYQLLDEPTRSNTKELFILAHYSLKAYMTRRTDTTTESSEQHRWTQMVALSKMMQAMNREHHDILSTLKELRPDLHFPELYIEMFQLADSASALFSASAKAVTLACSSAFQPLAPLKLSLCTTPTELGSSASSDMLYSQSGESTTAEVSTVNSSHAFLPTNDRWDAGRLALAVPAAVAAIAAVSAEASALSQDVQHRQQQQHIQHQPQLALPSPDSTVQRPTSIIVNSSTTNPNSSYFTAPSSFFFPTSQSQQQQQ